MQITSNNLEKPCQRYGAPGKNGKNQWLIKVALAVKREPAPKASPSAS